MSGSEEREQLDELRKQGLLNDDEHREALNRLAARDTEAAGSAAPPRSRPRWMSWWPIAALLVGLGLIIFALVGTGGGGSTKEPGIKVNGYVVISVSDNSTLPDDPNVPPGSTFNSSAPGFAIGKGCHAVGGFADIKAGAPVVITGPDGKQLAATALQNGVYDSNADCAFPFTAAVPKTSNYNVKIAQRNPVSFAQREIGNAQLQL